MGSGTSWPGSLPLRHICKSICKWLNSFNICPKLSIPTVIPSSQVCHLLPLCSKFIRIGILSAPFTTLCPVGSWFTIGAQYIPTWVNLDYYNNFPTWFPYLQAAPCQHFSTLWSLNLTGMMILPSQISKWLLTSFTTSQLLFRLCKTFHYQASFCCCC